ncbi:hypothetical protein Y032_0012g1794 [Ancylostoma ceylanicum]|uniref:Uncharacterized protein n=1 Tax=Ancylostoma ceylanicum TaxID=53326 RepID=A0A016VE06_9BILA|nr:hypothetical protein Y032_0012g1794 [Ancylostoma ceylanicum]
MTCGVLLAELQQTTGGYRSPARVMAGGAPARHPKIYRGYVSNRKKNFEKVKIKKEVEKEQYNKYTHFLLSRSCHKDKCTRSVYKP